MAHHGDNSEALDFMGKMFAERLEGARPFNQQLYEALKVGPTGQFPEGKLNEDDEGEIRIAIGHQDGKVVIDFGKPVAWLGFTPSQARGIAETLINHADRLDGIV